jgi:RNA polymerase sigma factor (sigma-70 family)
MPPKPHTHHSGSWSATLQGEKAAHNVVSSLDGFADLYREHFVAVYRYHHARTGCVADAQDLTAETFHAALESFSRYQPAKGSPIAWLMGIARHKLADYFRHAPKDISLAAVEAQPAEGPSPEVQAGQALQVVQVAQALRRINSARAEALALHLYAGFCLEETALALDKSPEAVKKLVQRGLADLRRILWAQEVE